MQRHYALAVATIGSTTTSTGQEAWYGTRRLFNSEVAIAVAATAAILSPRVRGILRKGAVYGLAGAFAIGDSVGSFSRSVGRGAQRAAASVPAGMPMNGGARADTPASTTTPEEAADELAAMTHDATGAPTSTARRRRTQAEPMESTANE